MKVLRILGTRGLPAAHGGFETFAEQLALFLVPRGWRVIVYNQDEGSGPITEDSWQGVQRVRIPVSAQGPKGTVLFDWLATRHAARHADLCLTLGYNTAVFCTLLRMARVPNVINMDGIEWHRAKWGVVAKTWFWLNEHAGSVLGNHLVADHPEIAKHLMRAASADKITMIPYGAELLRDLPEAPVRSLGLIPAQYLTLIARPEPENSVLEVVQAFSRQPRGKTLAVLGAYSDDHPYHRAVRAAAGPEVRFLGAIYDKPVVHALRAHCVAYVHGHRVGGTNPSLVEALGAANPVLAHDNRFNRWVAADAALYFSDANSAARTLDNVLADDKQLHAMRDAAVARHAQAFTWQAVLQDYEALLERWLPKK
jgi:glycosyltransferase involved in cell wall biosynthesis